LNADAGDALLTWHQQGFWHCRDEGPKTGLAAGKQAMHAMHASWVASLASRPPCAAPAARAAAARRPHAHAAAAPRRRRDATTTTTTTMTAHAARRLHGDAAACVCAARRTAAEDTPALSDVQREEAVRGNISG
jgi:hypothetical protein